MLVIVGESASGKSTLVNMLINTNVGYEKIITYTTRPMRNGEKDGVDYHFVSPEEFEKLVNRNFFIEYAKYRDWSYGTAKTDCANPNGVAVLTPAGLRALKRIGCDVTSIYLYVDRRARLINILNRGDNIDEAYRRNLSDVGQFDQIEKEVDFVINNSKFRMNKEQILLCLQKFLESDKENDSRLSFFDRGEISV